MTSLSDALSTLSDRGLRRLLGARTFLRGLDYARRKVAEDIEVGDTVSTGKVRGSEAEPYIVRVELVGTEIHSSCTCPAFAKSSQHCKHVAALLITVRDQVRSNAPKKAVAAASSSRASEAKPRKKERRRRPSTHAPTNPATAPVDSASASLTGIGAWLPPPNTQPSPSIEYRITVRQSSFLVTVIDTETRTPLLPSQALALQAQHPTAEREPLRVLARCETVAQRHPSVELRGEDAAELLSLLRDRRVLVEPALAQLRYSDEALVARFELEIANGNTLIIKACFERPTDHRRFSLSQGGYFEGAPGWMIDTTTGTASPLHKRLSPAAVRRLLRSPTIAEPIDNVPELIMSGLPRLATEFGAELPDLETIAEVVDAEPSFRMTAQGDLVHAEVFLFAGYGDVENQVRASGLGPPVLIQPPSESSNGRFRCIRCDIMAQQQAAQKLLDLGLTAHPSGEYFVAEGDNAIQFWSEGLGALSESWSLYVPDDLVDTQVRTAQITPFGRISSGVDWLSVKLGFEADGVAVAPDEIRRCLASGQKYVQLEDGTYATLNRERNSIEK